MKTTHAMCARFSALLFILFFSTTIYAGSPKVEVCHVPPGNPDNFHTIKINEKALGAHLAHGDLAGACSAACATLCDDGNACTVDDFGDCETNGCPTSSIPVDCSDGNLCTDDICDPSSGCANPVAVTCEAPDLCTISTCDPVFGQCEEVTMSCNEGESCNPSNGQCELDEPTEDACPCFTLGDLEALGDVSFCSGNLGDPDLALVDFTSGDLACSGDQCDTGPGTVSCATIIDDVTASIVPISGVQDAACKAHIAALCDANPSVGPLLSSPASQRLSDGKPATSRD